MRQGKNHVVVLSYPFWQRVFGGARDVVGRAIQLNGEPYNVVGVAPPGFGIASKVDVWIADGVQAGRNRGRRARRALSSMSSGRLKPGVTFAQARSRAGICSRPNSRSNTRIQTRAGESS